MRRSNEVHSRSYGNMITIIRWQSSSDGSPIAHNSKFMFDTNWEMLFQK
jgi:hypothetical protein